MSHTLTNTFSLIDEQLSRVKELITEQLTVSVDKADIARILKHINSQTGKMLRPGLVLLSYMACQGKEHKSGATEDALISCAAIVEMIHNATLLHDDVIDEGTSRRGLPTVNSLWGNESAVLLGDFLLSRVLRMCAELQPKLTRIIASTAARVCEGELTQTLQRQNWQLTEAEYIDIVTEKSASLFSGACHLGAVVADAGEKDAESLVTYGRNAGIAFQITDDLLDIVGNESKLGKTTGSDLNKNMPTLAVIHLLRTVDEEEKNVVINSLSMGRSELAKEDLIEMLNTYGSLDYARSRAKQFVTEAIESLDDIQQNAAKDALIETAEFITDRAT